jgi:hypothetical protein
MTQSPSLDAETLDKIVLKLESKCGPTYIGFEWAVKKTLEYLEERGSAKITDIAGDLRDDYMWIVRYLYWIYSESSIPRLVRCVVEELAGVGLARLNGGVVTLVR